MIPNYERLLLLRGVLKEAEALADLTRALDERIALRTGLSPTRQGVLRALMDFGPQPVPELAATRGVSRQAMQALINDLAAQGLVLPTSNPRHKRSPLVTLTNAGRELLAEASTREEDMLTMLAMNMPDIPGVDLHKARTVQSELRRWLEHEAQVEP